MIHNSDIEQRFSTWVARMVGIGIGVLKGGLMLPSSTALKTKRSNRTTIRCDETSGSETEKLVGKYFRSANETNS